MNPQRVSLRRPRSSDEGEWLAVRAGSKAFLEQWEPNPPVGAAAGEQNAFDRMLAASWTDTHRRFVVIDAEGRMVGQCSLGQIIRGPLQQAFLGYWIAEPFTRKGFATAAIIQTLAYGFRTLMLNRIEANVQPTNAASLATLRRIGMRREGFSPKYLEIRGAFVDHERWAMLAEEFAAKHAEAHCPE